MILEAIYDIVEKLSLLFYFSSTGFAKNTL